ncbi:MAG TPA: hypothetical protein VND94_01005 [Terriglobia bacterium]|nr:hypothetical protein [Terriglobia bacterium]
MKANNLRVDSAAIEAGEWVKNIPGCEDLEIQARGFNCSAFQDLQAKKLAALSVAEKKDKGTAERIFNECVAEVCLMDLRNYTAADGTDIPVDQARAMALEPDRVPFLNAIKWAAGHVSRIRAEDEADAEKN